MEVQPNYYAVLTANVRYDNRLTDSEKLLYAEITALAESTGICWASNNYFAKLYGVSQVTISRRISKLKEFGYISVNLNYKKNSKEIENRVIKINDLGVINSDKGYYQNCYGGIINSDKGGIIKTDKENITRDEYYKINKVLCQNSRKISLNYKEVTDAYNSICVSYPKITKLSDTRKKAINARIASGYTYDDFIKLFELAEESRFLKGGNKNNWQANFDWLIKDANMAKVIDGNYSDKKTNQLEEDDSDGFWK